MDRKYFLDLLLQDPGLSLLCDRLAGFRSSDQARTIALDMMGYIVRKQPNQQHRVAQHQLTKDLLKLLKIEIDVEILVSILGFSSPSNFCETVKLFALLPDPVQVEG